MNNKVNNITMVQLTRSLRMIVVAAMVAFISTISVQLSAQDCDELADLPFGCNNEINVALNLDCTAQVSFQMVYQGQPWDDPAYPSLDENDFIITISHEGEVIGSGPVVELGIEHVGLELTGEVSIPACGMACWGYINLEDKSAALLNNCVDYTITCEEFEDGNSQEIFMPNINGSCSIASDDISFTFSDDTLNVNCEAGFATTLRRTWTATGPDGEILSQCIQNVNVENMDVTTVVFPDDYIILDTAGMPCDTFNQIGPEVTGYPTGVFCPNIQYFYTDNNNFEMCGASLKLLREWTIVDWCTGAIVKEGQIIKIIDNQPPSILICPPDTLTFPTSSNVCEAIVNLDPHNLAHGIGAMPTDSLGNPLFVECSGVTITVEYLPAEPGTNQPQADGDYTADGIIAEADGTFTLPNIPEGIVWIRYRFADECGNEIPLPEIGTDDPSSCYFEVQVVDNRPPNPICEGFTKVYLDDTGHIEVFAETFDDHSFDVCDEEFDFEVKRLDTTCPGHGNDDEYSESVFFCCADLGDTLTVMLKVIDADGNFAECQAQVCVSDDGSSIDLTCPDDVTISCTDDFLTYDYGDTNSMSNGACGSGPGQVIDVNFDTENLDACGIGYVIREVIVQLPNGTQDSCEHIVVVTQDDPLTESDISVQSTITVDGCDYDNHNLDPDVIGGKPIITNNSNCVNVTYTYEDEELTVGNPAGGDACKKIRRTWTIIDWCLYDDQTNPGGGVFVFEQIISISDGQSPEFNNACEEYHGYADETCTAEIHLVASVSDNCAHGSNSGQITVSWHIDVYSDGDSSNDLAGQGAELWVTLPIGYHEITWTAMDACGNNAATCVYDIVIVGDAPPVAICLANINWSLNENGIAEVWAADFDLKSEGACGSDSNLQFSFTDPEIAVTPSVTFTCDDIPNGVGVNIQVQVWVVGGSGSSESCYAVLTLLDSQDACQDDAARVAVSGTIYTEYEEGLASTEVELHMMEADDMMSMHITESTGEYMFEDLDMSNTYMVAPKKEDDPLNGVTTLDLLKIQKHILGQEVFDSPYKYIAADVNKSGEITGIDLIEIRKVILGIYPTFPDCDSWSFVPAGFEFVDSTAPWEYPTEEYISEAFEDVGGVDFLGVKMGDVNGSVVLSSSNGNIGLRSTEALVLNYQNNTVAAGEEFELAFNASKSQEISGVQFTLTFNAKKVEFLGINGAGLAIQNGHVNTTLANTGIITLSFDQLEGIALEKGMSAFTLDLRAKQNGDLNQLFAISSELTSAEAYDVSGNSMQVILEQSTFADAGNKVQLFQNKPNPFGNETNIGFYLPEGSDINFEVMSTDGKVVYRVNNYFEKGHHVIELDASTFENQGIMLYKLESGEFTDTKKMILIK